MSQTNLCRNFGDKEWGGGVLSMGRISRTLRYVGGPTFKSGGPIFGREGSRNTPIPLFEQPLKLINHRHIFERIQ